MTEQNGSSPRGYLLFVWSPTGYSVSEREGEPPHVGEEVEGGLVATKIGASPFPGDSRACVYSMGRG
ncbi:MAG TPA: hypothetical protein VGL76_05425 [Gaiellaceae bacterium]|jgi:hypothetical protein